MSLIFSSTYCSNWYWHWSNGLRYHIFEANPDNLFKGKVPAGTWIKSMYILYKALDRGSSGEGGERRRVCVPERLHALHQVRRRRVYLSQAVPRPHKPGISGRVLPRSLLPHGFNTQPRRHYRGDGESLCCVNGPKVYPVHFIFRFGYARKVSQSYLSKPLSRPIK